jgi:chromosome segregation ATPase
MNNEKPNSLTEQIQITETLLENLKSERDDFPNRMTTAVAEADSASMFNLKHRQSQIPDEIATGQIRLAKLQLQADEERLPMLQAKLLKFAGPTQAAVLKRDAAVLEFNKLQDEHNVANDDLRELNRRIGQRKRELDRMIYEANPATIPGTNLRSLKAT